MSEKGHSEQQFWLDLLQQGRTPVWVPKQIGANFALAHEMDDVYPASPASVLVNVDTEKIGLTVTEGTLGHNGTLADLESCLSALLSLSLRDTNVMRHVYQQTALLWRTYRDTRTLGTLSSVEADMVPRVVAGMVWPGVLAESLAVTVAKQAADGKIRTLHDLIDVMFYYIRDAQYKGRPH